MSSSFGVEHVVKADDPKPSRLKLKAAVAQNTPDARMYRAKGRAMSRRLLGSERAQYESQGFGVHDIDAPDHSQRYSVVYRKKKAPETITRNGKTVRLRPVAVQGVKWQKVSDNQSVPYGRNKVALAYQEDVAKRESKRKIKPPERLPKVAEHVLPSSSIRAYDNTKQRSTEALAVHTGTRLAASAAGAAGGAALGAYLVRKVPAARGTTKILAWKIKPATKTDLGRAAGTAVLGGVGGAAGSEAATRYIKRSRRYDYKEE